MVKHAYLIYIVAALALIAVARLGIWYLSDLDPLLTTLAALNLATFGLMGWDKGVASTKIVRVPEAIFWLLALVGGSAGLLLGMRIFRHKTQKAQFQIVVVAIIAVQAVIVSQLGVHLR